MKSEKYILTSALLLTCLSFNTAWGADPIWQGSGTISDPYRISTSAELIYLADNDEFYSDNFILTADIDLAGNTFTEALIAPEGDEFDGLFDGNYHKIININIDAQTSNANYLGLFGQTGTNAEIMNLGLENIIITGGSSSSIVGTMAGYCNCEITNCYSTGTVTSGSGAYNIGGFIGVCQSTIINCFADVDVSGGTGSQRLGGFAGINQGAYLNCYASGAVSGGSSYTKGFVGYSFSSYGFVGCYHLDPNDGGGPVDSYAEALTDTQMKDPSSFAGWDFFGETSNGINEIWMMDVYPALSWQMPVGFREFSMLANYWGQTDFTQDEPHSRADWHVDGTVNMSDLGLLVASWLERVIEKSYPLALDDDFETGAFTKQPWFLGGSADWVIDDVIVQHGNYSAKSGPIGDSQSSYLELTVDTTGYDLITFYYKVSSEENFDFFRFYIDGSWRIEHGGDSGGWIYRTFPVYDGLTTFKWSYDKDSSGYDGDDCAWVDNIVFTME